MENITITKGNYTISTDKSLIDINAVHDFLANHSYWAKNIPLETVQNSVQNSLCFGLFLQGKQLGFARVISDFATIAYLGDVYVLHEHRGQGLSKWLIEQVMAHPALQGLRRWVLLTADAHKLYEKYGWRLVENPDRYMEVFNPNVYQ